MKLRELKQGDYFKLKPNGRVYVRQHYCRDIKKYSYCDFNDVCKEHFKSGNTEVIIDLNDDDFEK